ncbi:UDP-N-acetylmuramoyl-L-alanyl-D-glutamate--2,6-diaminopimelate ligase [Litorivivens lipolytica]|uniref:UDP-N-acetylmuramoyl-L-alanyl-D-glutamate--2,6-diaminopimelate ligase n=1 Tax=Litorivivens lipolytica TaxID=1524264 RepID=A0A7W4W596_9GAMM|nr:UDP-N-acetylmuramoyl-L-alanyl-D-glutamate--2,6-diaminopimelate ligase [Litorivivens lipolytica]MBB3047082.1 UDP-N-acetylmuramoyl-L-alanyl-D-glutamate--2,6-diaminopimelate ligase [Litorivivens lipolytica]
MGLTATVLGDLLDGVAPAQAAVPVSGIALDSRQVRAGDVFLAVRGHSLDGRDFIDKAIAKGAAAVIADAPCDESRWPLPVIAIDNLSQHLSEIAGRFYCHPSRNLSLIGVTGTNGKSSVTHYLAQLLELLGHPCGVMGTLGAGRIQQLASAVNTTPDAVSVQQTLAQWRDGGARWAAMEVSSHGLVQGRVSALQFSSAVFTNLTQDHLDYHGTMEAYGAAKARLFAMPGLHNAILNADDDYSAAIECSLPASVHCIRFGFGESAHVRAVDVDYSAAGIKAEIQTPWGSLELNTSLCASVNLLNILASIAVLGAEGFALRDIERALPSLRPVPGRLEKLAGADGVQVVVDYAHTPDALEKVLQGLRPHCKGKLWCVFGCGGDRDKGKRPLMGRVAEQYADRVVLTSDNPRSEIPEAIIADIRNGLSQAPYSETSDRQLAIEQAIAAAAPGDLVVIAGKGHEDYQETAGKRLPFSDVQCSRLALARRVPS